MKYFVILAATATLALCACSKSQSPTPTAPGGTPATAEAKPAAPQPSGSAQTGKAAFVVGQAPSKEFMAGIWGQGDACTMPINFQPDGTIKDGPFAKWDIQNGYLIMDGAPQKLKLEIIDAKTMRSQIDGDKKIQILKRCSK